LDNQQGQNSFKFNLNGQEYTGDQARELAQQMFSKLPNMFGSLGLGTFGNILKNATKNFNLPSTNDVVKDIANIADVKKMLPVFEVSNDSGKMKMTMNGETLFDLDLQNLVNNATKTSKDE
jgi:hypothetical protein